MQFLAAAIAAGAALKALQVSATAQRMVAFDAARERDLADIRRNELEIRYAETLHEVRSTVLSLEGGMRFYQQPLARKERLAQALLAELARLRSLVEHENAAENTSFAVNDALEPFFTLSEAGAQTVQWDIPEGISARGRGTDVAQIVHTLLMKRAAVRAGELGGSERPSALRKCRAAGR